MLMSTTQLWSRPAAVVNCHCTPVSLDLSTETAGLPPVGAPGPTNGIMNVVGVDVTVNDAWGAYDVLSPAPLGFSWLLVCALSLVAYCSVQPVPPTLPQTSN